MFNTRTQMTNPFDTSIRRYNSLLKAIYEFINFQFLQKPDRDKWEKELDKIKTGDEEALKVYVDNKFDNDADKIRLIAKRILKEKDKQAKKRLDTEDKDFENKIKKAASGFKKDYIDLAEEFWETQPFYYDSARIWWLWDFKRCCWIRIDDSDLFNTIYGDAKEQGVKITSPGIKAEITTALKMVGRKHKPIESPPNIIQFKDNIYYIDSGNIKPSSPEYFNCNPIPWDIGESKETPIMDKIFEEWVGPDQVQLLYEVIAYCMIQDYPLNRIFCFVGCGSNGKTCYLNVLKRVVGEKNCASTELDRLVKSFGTSVLYKKLVCLMGETNFGLLEKTSILKRISGNDTIDFEFKGKDIFVGKSYAKLIIATNTVPPTTDKTLGFFRRWILIDFPNIFSEKKDILIDIPDIEYNNLCKKCVDIVRDLIGKRRFTNEGSVEDRKKRYEELSNPLKPFLKENYKTDLSGFTPIYLVFETFNTYLSQRGLRNVTKNELTKLMENEGIGKVRKDFKGNQGDWKQYWCYESIVSYSSDHSDNETKSNPMYRDSIKPLSELYELYEKDDSRVLTEEEVLDEMDKIKENGGKQ